MPASNETLIAVPLDVTNSTELRIFLTKLIVALDVLIGLRGGETPLVTKEFLQAELDKPVELPEKLKDYSQVMDATYNIVQIQALSDAVTNVTNKVNELL